MQTFMEANAKYKDHLKVIQLTDMHLFSDQAQKLHGYCTHQSLSDTIDLINASVDTLDFALVTGDISQDKTTVSYQLALAQFERLGVPVYWIHGNHDDESAIRPIFHASVHLKQLTHLSTPSWDFIALNTCRCGTNSGYLEESELASFWKKIATSQKSDRKIAVVMHHHPYPVATPLVDNCMLQESEQFLVQMNNTKEIKLIICGHVHGAYQISREKHTLESCPATCFQWKTGTDKVVTEDKRGFKVFDFYADSYQSSVIFV